MKKEKTTPVDAPKPKVLIVDDEISMCEFLSILLKNEGYSVMSVTSAKKGLEHLQKDFFDLVISDIAMPEMNGLELLKQVKMASPETAVIMITAYGTPESAIEAMKSGAFDYISKPFNNDAIKLTILKCLQTTQLQRENLLLKRQMQLENRFGSLIGTSAKMNEVYELIGVVRNNKSNVLITGESGTGKELVAREIHYSGESAGRPFVTVNCGAIPETLIESELFGHSRGAFTGAVNNRTGLFKTADGGTIFLDEIGELTLQTQVKLLRVLQTKVIRPIGSSEDVQVDVRIIAATNRELESMVKDGRFREDLFFRLNVIQIRLPALRERREDIPALTKFFVRKLSEDLGKDIRRISQESIDVLKQYSFPGNIRELENILERTLALEKSNVVLPESLPEYVRKDTAQLHGAAVQQDFPDGGVDLEAVVDDFERRLVEQALKKAGGVKTKAAELLKLSFRSFRYRLDKHRLD